VIGRFPVVPPERCVANRSEFVLREQRFRLRKNLSLLEAHVLFEKRSHRVRRVTSPDAADESPQARVILRDPVRQFAGSSLCQDGEQPPLLDAEMSLEVRFEFMPDFTRNLESLVQISLSWRFRNFNGLSGSSEFF
jgi:hypothetical protein